VPAEAVALVREVPPGRLKEYARTSHVPLKHFGGLFVKLSSRFSGKLREVRDAKLRKLKLPLVIPVGGDLPEFVDDGATHLLVLSHGNWHGIIACAAGHDGADIMIKTESGKNGDIAGVAHLDDGGAVTLLDVQSLLQRDGFLVMA